MIGFNHDIQKDPAALLLFLSAMPILLIALLTSCADDTKDPVTAEPPVFSVTPVNLQGPYDGSDSTFGDIKMIKPVITPFGEYIDTYQRTTNIEYYTRPGAAVLAVTRGLVETITENPMEPGNYEIRVRCLPGSDFLVIYKHITQKYVLEDLDIGPGDTIGFAGSLSDVAGMTALQVNNDAGDIVRAYCPLKYGNDNFKEAHQQLLDEYNRLGFTPSYISLCLTESEIP